MNQQVYFLRPFGKVGPIKVGCSVRPEHRVEDLATFGAEPLEVLVTIPGNLELERNLHECFLDSHSHREWFHASPRLLAAIAALQAGVPVEWAVDLSKRLGVFQPRKRKPDATSPAKEERRALNKRKTQAARNGRKFWPADLDVLMITAMQHAPLTDPQRARFEEVLAKPEQLLTLAELGPAIIAYREWLAAQSMARAA